MKVSIQHWDFHTGIEEPVSEPLSFLDTLVKYRHVAPRGYTCWAYTDEPENFHLWMKENMIGNYECTWRFNSGNPMFTIFITEDEDANLFTLKWR